MNSEISQEDSNIMNKQSPVPVEPSRYEIINKRRLSEKLAYFAGKAVKEPTNFEELDPLNPIEEMKCLRAMEEEMQSLKENHAYRIS